MTYFAIWYLLVSLIGLLSFPLIYRLLPGLPDRGYVFMRTIGLLLWGFIFWLLGSLGILQNDLGGMLFALGVILILVLVAGRRIAWHTFKNWARDYRRHIIITEVLFLAAFLGWALVRAANPEIYATEKPMELAFINAILKSPDFPPRDPWLSGYAISYYYFGYVLTAMLAMFSGAPGGIAFNLGISLTFALSAIGAYGVVYNLLAARDRSGSPDREGGEDRRPAGNHLGALLAPVFVLILGNFVGFLEVIHARGLLWSRNQAGELTSPIWQWLDLQELSRPPAEPFSWLPRNFGTGSWWWWRASRVIQDYDLSGQWREVIDEFPFFSFLLADLHPHVLAMPFAFLGMALALNIFLGGGRGRMGSGRLRLYLNWPTFIFGAVVLGAMAFLNFWDFPLYIVLFAGAYAFVRARSSGWNRQRAWDFLGSAVAIGLAAYLLYLPFHISFASQAGGIIPNLVYPTRGAHLWVMFGLFFIPLFLYLAYLWQRQGSRRRLKNGIFLTLGLVLLLLILMFILAIIVISLPLLEGLGLPGVQGFRFSEITDLFLGSIGAGSGEANVLGESLLRRLRHLGSLLTISGLLVLTLGLLWPAGAPKRADASEGSGKRIDIFVLLLILLGSLIVLGPEFFFLRDQFGWRINTIFKFYFQAWLLWGVAISFGVAVLVNAPSRGFRYISRVSLVGILVLGLIYPLFAIWDKTSGFTPPEGLTLDGTVHGNYLSPDDFEAVRWLSEAPFGVVTEAIGGSYSQYARVSAHTGQPTVLGWPGHESQWRGGAREMGTRERDVEHLYSTRSWTEAQRILDLYAIRYIYIGPLERATYGVVDGKFEQHLEPVYRSGAVIIYEVP